MPIQEIEKTYPKAYKYLRSWEQVLRNRENGKMDVDEKWWGYVYPKSLTYHELQKIIAPRLVYSPKFSLDENGGLYLDNVDVGA